MKATWRVLSGLLALLLVGLGLVWALPEQGLPSHTLGRAAGGGVVLDDDPNVLTAAEMQVVVGPLFTPTLTPAVRDLPPYVPGPPEFDREMARKDDFGFVGPDIQMPPHGNPLVDLQRSAPAPAPDAFGTPLINVAGVQSGSSPPDDTGDVGPNHYLQADNGPGGSRVTIYDKSGVQQGQFLLESLAPGSPCTSGYCDPVVVYDSLADRWFINEFSSASSNPFCLYVSQTADPLGAWYYYTWDLPYYDYPKYGLWPDAYYMGYNGGATGTRQAFAFNRARMLAGQSATYQMFTVPTLSGFGFQLVVPASLEGPNSPPAGAPGIFMRPRDTEIHGGTCPDCDLMEMWAFHVDWTTPANSTLTKLPDVQMTDYDCTLCGTGSTWNCMPQPGTTQKIDPIREPIHYQLQYRNFGTHETLVGCFVEDVDGTDHAAVRWFEIRRTPPGSGNWGLHQDGTVGGEANVHRSVCSAAMDGSGNIAVGYTRTGNNAPYYPSIYYSGRLSTDPLGTMPYYDNRIWDATTSKTNNERWGDYSGIGVDPADDCTFWYTTEYGGSGQTRVAAFKFDQCGVADFTLAVTPESQDICAGEDAAYDVSIGSLNGFGNGVTLSSSGRPGGTTESFVPNPVTPAGSSTFTVGNTGAAAAGTYNITVGGTAQDSPGHQEAVTLSVFAAAPGGSTLDTPTNGSTGVSITPVYDWSDSTNVAAYEIQVATDPAFANIVESATGLTSSTYNAGVTLDNDTVYYWRVRAVNSCGSVTSAIWAFRTIGITCSTYSSTDVPKAINNRSWAESTLSITDVFNATDVNVILGQVIHPNDADLDIYIRHPDTTQVELSTDNGGAGDNYIDTVFDDEAATPITSGFAPFTGSFRPEAPLTALYGKPAQGTWTLRIYDDSNPNTGSLQSWSLYICGLPQIGADYSDLAASYGIAWHTGSGALRLGPTWTADTDFLGPDGSDDGVSFPNGWVPGQSNIVRVNVQGTPTNGRWGRIWFDWNGDGVFGDAGDGERVYNNTLVSGNNDIMVTVPAGLTQPVNYRVRLYDSASSPLGSEAQDPGGYNGADGGEVEDGASPAPTAVRLVAFGARPAVGGVLVTWETASELDNAGFFLYRSTTLDELGVQLNEELIPSAAPGGEQGAEYEFLDAGAASGVAYYYTLEDVDVFGQRTAHGPIMVALWRAYLPLVGLARR